MVEVTKWTNEIGASLVVAHGESSTQPTATTHDVFTKSERVTHQRCPHLSEKEACRSHIPPIVMPALKQSPSGDLVQISLAGPAWMKEGIDVMLELKDHRS